MKIHESPLKVIFNVSLQKLTRLELWGGIFMNHNMPKEAIIQLPKILSMFANLEELNISNTKAGNDDCFFILGFHCKNLRCV